MIPCYLLTVFGEDTALSVFEIVVFASATSHTRLGTEWLLSLKSNSACLRTCLTTLVVRLISRTLCFLFIHVC